MKNLNSVYLAFSTLLLFVHHLCAQSGLQIQHTAQAVPINNISTPGAPVGLTITQANNGSNGVPSQFFSDFNGSADGADDFIVPAGCPRTIVSVGVEGTNTIDPFNPSSVTMNIYEDANGGVGNLLFSENFTGITNPSFTLTSTTCPPMPPGTYWLSIVVDMAFMPDGQWFWSTSIDEKGSTPYQWQDTAGLFGIAACATWGEGAAVCGVGGGVDPSLNYVISLSEEVPTEGGTLTGGPYDFCVGDGISDFIPAGDVTVSGNTGSNSAYVITDDQGVILGLPGMFSDVDFDGTGAGTCLLWHLSFEDDLTGAAIGANAADLGGCFALSNSIAVNRTVCPVATDPSIPTMGEWGLISLTILLAIFGIVAIKEKQLALE